MKKWLACSLLGGVGVGTFALLALSSAGCGGSSETTDSGTPDGGHMEDHKAPPPDHSIPDTGHHKDAAKDMGIPTDLGPMDMGPPSEGGPTPPAGGHLLVNPTKDKLSSIQVIGLTDDSQNVIYYATTGSGMTASIGVYAVAVSGTGSPVTILGGITSAAVVSIAHSTVFVWTGVTTDKASGNNIGKLDTVWTSAATSSPAVATSTAGLVSATPDGKKIAYASTNITGTFGSLVVANTDGTGTSTTLLMNTVTNASSLTTVFNPQLDFTSNGFLVMTHEEQNDGGTMTTATVSSWDTTAWVKNDLLVGPLPISMTNPFGGWSTSACVGATCTGGAFIAVADASGNLNVIPTAGPSSAAVLVEANVKNYSMLADGSKVMYQTTASALKSATVPPTTSTTILATGFAQFVDGCVTGTDITPCAPISESLDDNLTVFGNAGSTAGEYSISFVNDTTMATSTVLMGKSGAIFNDAFTTDSTNLLYYSAFTTVGMVGNVGYLWAYPVNGSVTAPGTSISMNKVWESNGMSKGTLIVYGDNFTASGSSTVGAPVGYQDLYTVDVAKTPIKPTPIMKSTDVPPSPSGGYWQTVDRTTIVWVMSQGNTSTNGIWSITP